MNKLVTCFLLSSWLWFVHVVASTSTRTPIHGAEPKDDLDFRWETVGGTDIDIQGIWDEFNCNEILADERPIIDESTWLLLRGVYVGIMGPYPKHSSIPLETGHGIQVPYEVKQFPGRGRGLVATEPISKGQVVYDGKFNACIEVDEDQDRDELEVGRLYRKFLASSPQEMVCVLMEWSFTFDTGICFSLDDTVFMNHGNSGDEENVLHAVAMRDVAAGEELFEDYSEFAGGDHEVGFERFGLGQLDEKDFFDQFWKGEEDL